LADKKDEVARFVRQHLGVEPGTDLRALFRQAMGVPQGTFTAIFLEGATERKAAFDKLLKVEEYRQGAEKRGDTVRDVENRIADARVSLARMETEIASADQATSELADVSSQIEKAAAEIAELAGSIAEHRATVTALDARERAVAELRAAADRLSGD